MNHIKLIEQFIYWLHRPGEKFFISANGKNTGHGGWQDHLFSDPAEAAQSCMEWRETHDLYVSMGTYQPGAPNRQAQYVLGYRVIWIDLDVFDPMRPLKPHEVRPPDSLDDAIGELRSFIPRLGRPPTIVELSGGGLQAFWITDELMPWKVWVDLSARLVSAVKQHGLPVKDLIGVTLDMARVMRLPETFNFKWKGKPRPTGLLQGSTRYRLATLTDTLLAYEPTVKSPYRNKGVREPKSTGKPNAKFRRAGGMNPLAFCGQLAKSLVERGKYDGYGSGGAVCSSQGRTATIPLNSWTSRCN